MRILLQPSSGKEATGHFEDTINGGLTLGFFEGKVTPEEYGRLSQFSNENIKVWGMVPSLDNKPRKEWLGLEENDMVLFYAKRKFFYGAIVSFKIHNKKLAEELWGFDNSGRTWEDIYFIKEGKQIEVSYKPEIIGYKPNHILMGAILLDEERSDLMKDYVENNEGEIIKNIKPRKKDLVYIAQKAVHIKTPDEAIKEIEEITQSSENKTVEEKVRTARALVRNSKFSRLVKEKASYICEVCGEKPFTQKNGMPYAEAHHINELSKTKIDSPTEMICVCPICHKVIHFGNKEALNLRKALKSNI